MLTVHHMKKSPAIRKKAMLKQCYQKSPLASEGFVKILKTFLKFCTLQNKCFWLLKVTCLLCQITPVHN